MTLRAVVLLALAAFAVHEARDTLGAQDHASAGHHVLIALPGLLAMVLATVTARPLTDAAAALVRAARQLLADAARGLRAPRVRDGAGSAQLATARPRPTAARGLARNLAGRAPPIFG